MGVSRTGSRFLVILVTVWASTVHSVSAHCSCYSFHRDSQHWFKSRDLCQKNNGDLVSMETEKEWAFIQTKIQGLSTANTENNEWWIGLVYENKQWQWLSNQKRIAYNKWQPDKPKIKNKEIYAIIAKNYPENTFGLFNNIQGHLLRGRICEYNINREACINNVDRWCSPGSTTSATTIINTAPPSSTPSDSHTTSTTADKPTGSSSPTQISHKSDKTSFPVHIVIIILVLLLLVCVVLAVLAFIWKRKREQKPRNSHLSKDSRVPVKLEQSNPVKNLNDKIIYADVINMDGRKIQIKSDSKSSDSGKDVTPYNSTDVCKNKYKNTTQDEKVRNNLQTAAIKRVDSEKVQLMQDMDGAMYEQENDSSRCLYENVQQRNDDDSTLEVLEDKDDTPKDQKLLYVQIADIKDTDSSCQIKMPPAYCETDYAVIVNSSKNT